MSTKQDSLRQRWCGLTALATITAIGAPGRGHADQAPAAAETPAAPVSDPAEKFNRGTFKVNQTLDHFAIAPTARAYRAATPHPVRDGFRHFAANLKEPEVFIAETLQAHPLRAATAVGRFAVNSTVGVGGLFDPAAHIGMAPHDTDMGVTLGRWGVSPGPSVQIPVMGPSNLRDATGGLLSIGLDPATYVSGGVIPVLHLAGAVVGRVDARARALPVTDRLERTSPDYYASLRDMAARKRAEEVREARGQPRSDREDPAPAPAGGPVAGL